MQARQLGRRRRDDGITAVFSSDLTRAAQTASAAFGASAIPMLYDWRQAVTRVGRFLADLLARRMGVPGQLTRCAPAAELS